MKNILSLIDLIDADTLIPIEKAFCEMSSMAAHITDPNGMPITSYCNTSDLCRLINKSKIGRARCLRCNEQGARMAKDQDCAIFYQCHAGLIDFAAPITIENEMLGCLVGGQILNEAPDEKRAFEIAHEINVEPRQYLAALRKLPIFSIEQIRSASDFLYTLTSIIAKIGSDRLKILRSNEELEQATQSKSDFLANMSHEIRTPMNAISGMSEMAMREPLPPNAAEYVNQIKVAGQTLLTILNDILDFSKVETGTVTIHPIEYQPVSLINDITNTIATRIGDKDIEFTVYLNPKLPNTLLGDHVRLNQIILNLTNNAVKFTQQGQIHLNIDFIPTEHNELMLHISVTDTGLGIRKNDIDKLFDAFERVNTNRVRHIEGSGLGLAITKQLLTHMGGTIHVESEFGKGSCFSVSLPQKIINRNPSVTLKDPKSVSAAGLIGNPYIAKQLLMDLEQMSFSYLPLKSDHELELSLKYHVNYLFLEHGMYSKKAKAFIEAHPDITAILLVEYNTIMHTDLANVHIVKKPLYCMDIARIFNHELSEETPPSGQTEKVFDYIAPTAQILIVDDNKVNLTVAEGLLEPLEMQIDTAISAKEAIDKVSRHTYDLIFMDHMMPEVDGVEATHIIRRFYPNYKDTPIIALSANAVHGVKARFLAEGMNDFVPKPIELPVILSTLRKWLPAEKIKAVAPSQGAPSKKYEKKEEIHIEGLDTKAALKLLGSEKLFWDVLKDYYRVIRKKADLIHELEQAKDWKNYTIEVHALKSASRQIGAIELADLAARMEQAGNECDADMICKYTPSLIEQYLAYANVLEPYFKEADTSSSAAKPEATADDLRQFFAMLRTAFDNLDMDQMEEVIEKMKLFSYAQDQTELFTQLCGAVNEIDTDASEDIIKMWETLL